MKDRYGWIIILISAIVISAVVLYIINIYPPPDYMKMDCHELQNEIKEIAFNDGGFSYNIHQMVRASLIKGC